jgi:hypothetical protein
MDPDEFDRVIARAQNPQLVPGIYNYCDGRCPRCPFTERCLRLLEDRESASANAGGADDDSSLAESVGASMQLAVELVEASRRRGIDLTAIDDPEHNDARFDAERHRADPLAMQAREYGRLAWRIAKAVEPLVVARGDPAVIDAVGTIDWFSSLISAKVYRAICGLAERRDPDEDVQTDYNGSAKIALLGIEESRRAWRVLMAEGKATANGVPAQAVNMLDELAVAVRARFPRAMAFVRPGFDEPDVAADAPATPPAWERRPDPRGAGT